MSDNQHTDDDGEGEGDEGVDLSTDTNILPFKKTEAWGRKEGSVDLMMMMVMMIMMMNMINSDDVHPRRADSQTLQI